jgi:hypothetical protein
VTAETTAVVAQASSDRGRRLVVSLTTTLRYVLLTQVNSTLDINLYSTCTSCSIVYTASRALAQQLLAVVEQRRTSGTLKKGDGSEAMEL